MMGEQQSEPELFNYAVNLENRVRSNHPLRRVKAAIDFGFVREEVARWRRLWRQQIQDYLIAAIQNVRILLAHQNPKNSVAAALFFPQRGARLQPGFAY
jgi:hypothetical protein